MYYYPAANLEVCKSQVSKSGQLAIAIKQKLWVEKNCESMKNCNLQKTLSYKNWQLQKLTITKTVNYKNSELQKIVHYENSDSWKFWITKHMSYTNCKLQKLFVIKTVKPEYINIMYHWWEVDMDWKMCFEKKVYA